MKYKVQKVVEEIDLMELDESEIDQLNDLFRSIAEKNYPNIPKTAISEPVSKVILINKQSVRVELLIQNKKPVIEENLEKTPQMG